MSEPVTILPARRSPFDGHPAAAHPNAAGHTGVRLQAGMGLVGHNVLHDRSAFVDDPASPRLLYRARFLDRVARLQG